MRSSCWLPELLYYNNFNSWSEYQDVLYEIFREDFIKSCPIFENKKVNIRKEPIEFGKEEAFFHITCQDYSKNGNRNPDLRRCERIRWVRKFIEEYKCDSTLCNDCNGIKLWVEPYHSRSRIHILLEEEKYMVVLERRKNYILLITAFYFEWENALKKKLKKYNMYKNNNIL